MPRQLNFEKRVEAIKNLGTRTRKNAAKARKIARELIFSVECGNLRGVQAKRAQALVSRASLLAEHLDRAAKGV